MSETDDAISGARGTIDRIRGRPIEPVARGRKRHRGLTLGTRLALIGAADAVILIAAAIVGMVIPLGIFGALAVLLLMVTVTLAIAFAPARRGTAPTPEKLRAVELKSLPRQTGRWLEAQRAALPAPAMTLVDQIGVRLEALEPQLATLGDAEPVAADIRQLVGEQLPEFVRGYAKVPTGLRGVPRNGKTPDAQLVDGLKLIERQIGEMSAQLAQGDLDTLQTRGRFLEIKYSGDEQA